MMREKYEKATSEEKQIFNKKTWEKYREMTVEKIWNYWLWDAAKDVIDEAHRTINAKRDRPHISEQLPSLIDDRETAMKEFDIEEAVRINKHIKKQKKKSKEENTYIKRLTKN